MLIGTLSKVGELYVITSRVIDIQTSKVEFADSELCRNETDIEAASRILAIRLLNSMTGRNYDVPIRNYYSDEQRNRFAVTIGFAYGYLPNMNLLQVRDNFEIYESTANKFMITIAPNYEIYDFLTIGINFHYVSMQICNKPDLSYSSPTVDSYTNPVPNASGYGGGIWGQLSYKEFNGFTPWVSLGFDIIYYDINNNTRLLSYRPTAGGVNYYNIVYNDVFCYAIAFKIGANIYISRFVEFFIASGINISFLSEYCNFNVIETFNGAATKPADNYEGNFPVSFLIQVGFNLRVF